MGRKKWVEETVSHTFQYLSSSACAPLKVASAAEHEVRGADTPWDDPITSQDFVYAVTTVVD